MASFSRGESLATSKNVFWIASRYFLSAPPAADSFTKGNTQSEVSLSRVRSSAVCSGPGSGSGSASSTFAGGGVVAGVFQPEEVCGAGFGVPHSCEGGGAVWSVFLDCADAANDTATTSANRTRMWKAPQRSPGRFSQQWRSRVKEPKPVRKTAASLQMRGWFGSWPARPARRPDRLELLAASLRFQGIDDRADVLGALRRKDQQRVV